jgi:hypothetical protein
MKIRALAVLVPLLALAGCADNNVSIQVFGICAPPAEECSFAGKCDAYTLDRLRLDVAQAGFYWALIEVHNNTGNNQDNSAGRPNTHDAYVEEFSVEYELPLIPGTTPAIPTMVTERVESGPTVVPAEGTSIVSVFPITPAVATALRDRLTTETVEVVAKVRLRGFYADQTRFETAEFPLPIQVCDGAGCVPLLDCDATLAGIQPPIDACPQLGQAPASPFCGVEEPAAALGP